MSTQTTVAVQEVPEVSVSDMSEPQPSGVRQEPNPENPDYTPCVRRAYVPSKKVRGFMSKVRTSVKRLRLAEEKIRSATNERNAACLQYKKLVYALEMTGHTLVKDVIKDDLYKVICSENGESYQM